MSFWELPWLVVSFFVRGDFGRNEGSGETPTPGLSLIGMIALLAVLMIVAIWRADC